jgi:hypothetical protein
MFGNWLRLAFELQARRREALCHQRSLVHVQQMIRDVHRRRVGVEQPSGDCVTELTEVDATHIGRPHGVINEVPPVWKKLRCAVPGLTRRENRDGSSADAFCGNALEPAVDRGGIDDEAILIPRAATRDQRSRELVDAPARDVHSLDPIVSKETDRPAVRRPEW